MELGTTPVSLFLDISQRYSMEIFVKEGGIRPRKKLEPNSSISRLGRELPIFGGKSPLRSQSDAFSSVRLERLRIGCGKLPEKLLSPMYRYCSPHNFANSLGMLPSMLLLSKPNTNSAVMLARESGMVPVRLLYPSISC